LLEIWIFFSKNMVFKHFLTPFPFPVAKFINFLWKSAGFFQKTWFLSNFGPHFRFLWPNFTTFCHKAREAFENFEKSTSVSSFFSNFAIFRPQFHQLFATRRVKPWKIWKNSWLPAEIELLPVENPRKLVKFSKLFAKILEKFDF